MAQSIISKEELLENAYEIAEEGGISALSIRGLATKSGVSVGTVYRFFAAKDELTIATIELYFARAFYKEFCHLDTHTAFVDYCGENGREHAPDVQPLSQILATRRRGSAFRRASRSAPARVAADRARSKRPCRNLQARPEHRSPICPTASLREACASSRSTTCSAACATKTATAKCCSAF